MRSGRLTPQIVEVIRGRAWRIAGRRHRVECRAGADGFDPLDRVEHFVVRGFLIDIACIRAEPLAKNAARIGRRIQDGDALRVCAKSIMRSALRLTRVKRL